MAVTASILGTLQVTDNLSGSVALSKLLNFAFVGSVEAYAQSLTTSTSPLSILLPVNPTQFVFFHNLDTVNSVIVTWTPNGGSSNVIQTLDPGAVIILCQNTTTNGVSALQVQASANTPAIEYILVG